LWRCVGELAFVAAAVVARRERCLRGEIEAVAGERVEGSCRGRGWRICRIGARWVGIVVVAVQTAAVVVAAVAVAAAAGIGAYQSVEEPSAAAVAAVVVVASVAAFAAEAYRSAAEPSVSARMDFVLHSVGSSECSVAAACSLAAGSSALVAEQALAEAR